ncbi:MAG: hypothetical protein AVO35_06195 [Candidatus Aegiribacteria sp. MLS_C]|nr:MAG: hypothetical protein AVO35_06195 [Candidatus Aegiribacteria sp. MLS_C]
MQLLMLVLLAVAPPVAFLVYILRRDRVEPEPLGLVLKMLFLGCLSVIPAMVMELLFTDLPLFNGTGIAGSALKSFLLVAPVEEAVKLLTVLLFVWRNENFDQRGDGIVYTGTVAIGFAMAENLMYVLGRGWLIGVLRAVTSIPSHTFTGVLMGCFVGAAKFASNRKDRARFLVTGFLVAWLFHGAYNTFALSGTAAALLVVPLVIALFMLGSRSIRKNMVISGGREKAVPAAPVKAGAARRARRWHKVAGRTLLVLSGIFWVLVGLGLLLDDMDSREAFHVILGTMVLTAVPFSLGIILEIAHRRRARSMRVEGVCERDGTSSG